VEHGCGQRLTLTCRPDILTGVNLRACDLAVLLRAGADTILLPAKLSAVRMLGENT
jgi:hypothetical protein